MGIGVGVGVLGYRYTCIVAHRRAGGPGAPCLLSIGILHKNRCKILCNLYIDFFPKL
nr:MAG TPA: hypothetical protein [Caudoviricetes sp.]